ncbi:hypothetical protein C2S53_019139 [Perilla frutescens var. hirtella]|uniref:DEAD/DEAH-box helicase domain-containing protein n=1 Tax=Perilla frutescens var. hirtella TaxID=608512 RepID=A0AAD4PGL3_PERFH|nr:hypothetical protein C2S53_019139 [Perilla frutescens var. hirtella]
MNTMEIEFGNSWNGRAKNTDVHKSNRKREIVESESVAALVTSVGIMGPEIAIDVGKPTFRIIKWDGSNHSCDEDGDKDVGCPSKFLIMCLNSIQNDMQQDDAFTKDNRPFFANSWGFEFWSCYTNGRDVLDMDVTNSKIEKIAWITASAADTISMKEKEGVSFNDPFLLYLVPSQDKAYKARQVCQSLESVGICTLFLHSGVSIDIQIQSLKSSEPEFIVSTPERLLELLSLKAIDISNLSLMIIDGMEAPFGGTYLDAVKSMRQCIGGKTQTVILCYE